MSKKEYLKEWQKKNPDKVKTYQNKYYQKNKLAYSKREKKWRTENPEKNKGIFRKYRHNITLEQYNELLQKQNGCCGICKSPQENFKKLLAVDHNHITKKIRGLLCDNCNLSIGRLKTDEGLELLYAAIAYIQNNS